MFVFRKEEPKEDKNEAKIGAEWRLILHKDSSSFYLTFIESIESKKKNTHPILHELNSDPDIMRSVVNVVWTILTEIDRQ